MSTRHERERQKAHQLRQAAPADLIQPVLKIIQVAESRTNHDLGKMFTILGTAYYMLWNQLEADGVEQDLNSADILVKKQTSDIWKLGEHKP